MKAIVGTIVSIIETLVVLGRATFQNVTGHWALAIFSLLAAGGIWFAIQDIENPRVESPFPLDDTSQGIPVEYVNLSPDYVVSETARVRLIVEAREGDLPDLRASDFRARVDVQDIEPGAEVFLPVNVDSLDESVRVVSVSPERVAVELIEVARQEFQVEVNVTGALPTNFVVTGAEIDPRFVTVSGRPELVRNVDSVQIDVNLSGQRESFEFTGPLVARNSNGDTQVVSLSANQATVRFSIEPVFVEKLVPVRPQLSGDVAAGFIPTAINIDPAFVAINGPPEVLSGITEVLLEPLDMTGASSTITQSRTIIDIPNVSFASESAVVEVVIDPVLCNGSDAAAPCGAALFVAAPTFTNLPAGLVLAPGVYTVRVHISGPLDATGTLDPRNLSATVSLTGANEGENTVTPTVTVPAPFRVDSVEPMTVRLVATSSP